MTKQTSSQQKSFGFIKHKTALALGLILAGALFAGSVSAQVAGVAVVDTPGNKANLASFAKQLAQTVKQYDQMLTSAESLGTKVSLEPNSLQPIGDPSSLIQADCSGSSSGGITGNLMNSLGSLLSKNMSQSQQQICAQIVTTQVDKYNKTVDILSKLNGYSASLQKLTTMASSFKNMGESSSATTQATTYSSQLTTEMNDWEAQMRADDAIIKTLQDQQMILAKVALNGGGGSSILSDALPDTGFQNAINGIPQ